MQVRGWGALAIPFNEAVLERGGLTNKTGLSNLKLIAFSRVNAAMVSVNQFLVHYYLVTTSFLVLLFQLLTQLVYIKP